MGISRSLYLGPFAHCRGDADVMDLTSEALCEAEVNMPGVFAIPNVRRKGAPARLEEDNAIAVDLRSRDMAAECAWFERAFAPELAKLHAAFASVEVKWGLLQWFS
jgi:hypothetical protein